MRYKVIEPPPSIEAITVSVNYGDFLHITLPVMCKTFKKVIVSTIKEDRETIDVCHANDVQFVISDAHTGGVVFNKGAMINNAYEYLAKNGAVVYMDADIMITDGLCNALTKLEIKKDVLYGVDRLICQTHKDLIESRYHDREHGIFGYFQLFDPKSEVLKERKLYSEIFHNASGFDNEFDALWPKRERIKAEVIHLGERIINWNGRVSPRFT